MNECAVSQKNEQLITSDLQTNLNMLQAVFHYPTNTSLKIRELFLPSIQKEVILLFLEGAADSIAIEQRIVQPLLQNVTLAANEENIALSLVMSTLTSSNADIIYSVDAASRNLLYGSAIILIEGLSDALSISLPGFEKRSISTPKMENVLKGPKEAFVESASSNRSLLRKQIKDCNLVFEQMIVGEQALAEISVVYIKNLANDRIVQNIKDRIQAIKIDALQDLSFLEQLIEERPYSLIPSTLLTERPDRVCAFLLEGHVALLMENSPYALIAPITFWSLFHTPEDQYLRWAYGNFIRAIRLFAVFVALLTPSLYIAVSTFHQEMIQTDLLLAIGATRERVPFPAVMEVVIMEIAFELLREAGIRIPTVIGPTIGIVGALILGQAAVDANVISPILVIVVAITGLSSFAIPEISFNFGVRILRFFVLTISAFIGFYGIALFMTAMVAYMTSLKSFGVPFLSPLSPWNSSSQDLIYRLPERNQWLRPLNLLPKIKIRSKKPKGK
jgi:spore germination protein KA